MHTLRLTFSLEPGLPGTDDDPQNPMSRAFQSLLVDGKPFRDVALCFYGGDETKSSLLPPKKWLGVFILSEGNRILFFPGLSMNPNWVQQDTLRGSTKREDFDLDHLSLEPSRLRWHITSTGSRDHQSVGRTPELGDSRLLWLGMSIADESLLRDLKAETKVIAQSPSTDSDRRLRKFTEVVNGAAHNIISLPKEAKLKFSEGFLHFTFVFGNQSAVLYKDVGRLLPINSPYLAREQLQALDSYPIRFHEVKLGKNVSIQIGCSWLPGSPSIPMILTYTTSL